MIEERPRICEICKETEAEYKVKYGVYKNKQICEYCRNEIIDEMFEYI